MAKPALESRQNYMGNPKLPADLFPVVLLEDEMLPLSWTPPSLLSI
jgi:hypothetical protein